MHLEKQSDRSLMEKPLQLVDPTLYEKLKQSLAHYHLHEFDVAARASVEQDGILLHLRYGENLSYLKEKRFKWETVKADNAQISDFFLAACEDIKQALISDYFKMMKA